MPLTFGDGGYISKKITDDIDRLIAENYPNNPQLKEKALKELKKMAYGGLTGKTSGSVNLDYNPAAGISTAASDYGLSKDKEFYWDAQEGTFKEEAKDVFRTLTMIEAGIATGATDTLANMVGMDIDTSTWAKENIRLGEHHEGEIERRDTTTQVAATVGAAAATVVAAYFTAGNAQVIGAGVDQTFEEMGQIDEDNEALQMITKGGQVSGKMYSKIMGGGMGGGDMGGDMFGGMDTFGVDMMGGDGIDTLEPNQMDFNPNYAGELTGGEMFTAYGGPVKKKKMPHGGATHDPPKTGTLPRNYSLEQGLGSNAQQGSTAVVMPSGPLSAIPKESIEPNKSWADSAMDIFEGAKASINPMNWGVDDYTESKEHGKYGADYKGEAYDFQQAFDDAKRAGEPEFMYDNNRYTTEVADMSKEDEFAKYGITSSESTHNNAVRDTFVENIRPDEEGYGYSGYTGGVTPYSIAKSAYDDFISGDNKVREKVPGLTQDIFNLYLGKPVSREGYGNNPFGYNTDLKISKHRPSKSSDENANYFTLDKIGTSIEQKGDFLVKELSDPNSKYVEDGKIQDYDYNLGKFQIAKGEDEHGTYISYYDKWDLDPTGNEEINPLNWAKNMGLAADQTQGIGKPVEFYDKKYYTLKTVPSGRVGDFTTEVIWEDPLIPADLVSRYKEHGTYGGEYKGSWDNTIQHVGEGAFNNEEYDATMRKKEALKQLEKDSKQATRKKEIQEKKERKEDDGELQYNEELQEWEKVEDESERAERPSGIFDKGGYITGKKMSHGGPPPHPPSTPATRADSLSVLNSTAAFQKAMEDLKYSPQDNSGRGYDPQQLTSRLSYSDNEITPNYPRFMIKESDGYSLPPDTPLMGSSKVDYKNKGIVSPRLSDHPGMEYYLQQTGPNEYMANELLSDQGFNVDLPRFKLDSRIRPQGTSFWETDVANNISSPVNAWDKAEYPYYDDLAITPWLDLKDLAKKRGISLEEIQKERLDKYGTSGTPYADPKYTKTKPKKRQPAPERMQSLQERGDLTAPEPQLMKKYLDANLVPKTGDRFKKFVNLKKDNKGLTRGVYDSANPSELEAPELYKARPVSEREETKFSFDKGGYVARKKRPQKVKVIQRRNYRK